MKTIIAGSRTVTDLRQVQMAMRLSGFTDATTEVVSGGARGPDLLGETWARHHKKPIKRFPPDWLKLGKRAGIVRNCAMALYADALVAVWDGESRGTKHMITEATRLGLKVYVHRTK